MRKKEIEKLESEFCLNLAKEYRAVLENYPLLEHSDELSVDYNILRETNKEMSKGNLWDFPWSNNLWWIGEDGFGNFSFINCEEDKVMVYDYDHENPAASFDDKQALSPMLLHEYITMLKEAYL